MAQIRPGAYSGNQPKARPAERDREKRVLPRVTAILEQILPKTAHGTAPPVYVLLNPIPFDEGEPDNDDVPLATEEGTKKLIEQVSAQVADIPGPAASTSRAERSVRTCHRMIAA